MSQPYLAEIAAFVIVNSRESFQPVGMLEGQPATGDKMKEVAAKEGWVGWDEQLDDLPGTPSRAQAGFPVWLRNVTSVSRTMNVNGSSSCVLRIPDLVSAMQTDEVVSDVLCRIVGFDRDKVFDYSAIEDSAKRQIYLDYWDGTVDSQVGQFLSAVLNIQNPVDAGEPFITPTYPVSQGYFERAGFSTSGDFKKDYLSRVYKVGLDDMLDVVVFAVAPSSYPDQPYKWRHYFRGYIDRYTILYDPVNGSIGLDITLDSSIGYFNWTEMRSYFVLMELEKVVGRGEVNISAELDRILKLASSEAGLSMFKNSWYSNKPLSIIIDTYVRHLNACLSYLGLHYLATPGLGREGNYFEQDPQEVARALETVDNFFRYDYLLVPPAAPGQGNEHKAKVYDESIDVFGGTGEGNETEYLWTYLGEDMSGDTVGDDVTALKEARSIEGLSDLWWNSIRDRWVPRAYMDPLLFDDSVMATFIRKAAQMGEQATKESLTKVLQQIFHRVDGYFFNDSKGNFVVVSNRRDDLPAVKDESGKTLYPGWSPWDLPGESQWKDEYWGPFEEDWKGPSSFAQLFDHLGKGFVFRDLDNKYIIGADGLIAVNQSFDSAKVITTANIVGEESYVNFGTLISLLRSTRSVSADFYVQTKYGCRIRDFISHTDMKMSLPAILGDYELAISEDYLELLAAMQVQRSAMEANSMRVELTRGRSIGLELGRPVFVAGVRQKGLLLGIDDSINFDADVSDGLTLAYVADIAAMSGSPYLEFMIRYPDWGERAEEMVEGIPEWYEELDHPSVRDEVIVACAGYKGKFKPRWDEQPSLSDMVDLTVPPYSIYITHAQVFGPTVYSPEPNGPVEDPHWSALQRLYCVPALAEAIVLWVNKIIQLADDYGVEYSAGAGITITSAFRPLGHTTPCSDGGVDWNGALDSTDNHAHFLGRAVDVDLNLTVREWGFVGISDQVAKEHIVEAAEEAGLSRPVDSVGSATEEHHFYI